MPDDTIQARLEYLRSELRAERMSYGELAELQGLAEHIDPGDVELLEAAGVPEFPDEEANERPQPWRPDIPFEPGQPVLIDDRPGFISWVNVAPTPGYFWVGYSIDDVEYAGAHVGTDGKDKKGRTVFTMRRKTKLRMDNHYSDGHESSREVEVDPPGLGDEALEDWWEETVQPETGDGHGDGSHGKLGYCYTAIVLDTDDPRLQGEEREWAGY